MHKSKRHYWNETKNKKMKGGTQMMNIVEVTQDVTQNRNSYIGGSDIAAVMGCSRYKTALKLWAEKTGKIPMPDLSNNDAVHFGTVLEEVVAQEFAARTEKTVRRTPKVYQHKDYPYMVAHVDRIITGTDELLECKTCSTFKKDEWDNEDIPNEYILQVQWYLGITGRRIGYIACLIGGNKFTYKKIEFDNELFDLMVDKAKDFWQHVQSGEPVAVSDNDNDTMNEMYKTHSEDMIELIPEDEKSAAAVIDLEDAIAHRQQLLAEKSAIEKEVKGIDASLKNLINDNQGIITPKFKVTWKLQNGGYSYDKEQMLADNVFDKYATQITYRRINVNKNKENEVA